jgi:hypothetical protein
MQIKPMSETLWKSWLISQRLLKTSDLDDLAGLSRSSPLTNIHRMNTIRSWLGKNRTS